MAGPPPPQVGHGSTENRIETTDQKPRSHFTDGEADTPTGSVGPRQPRELRVKPASAGQGAAHRPRSTSSGLPRRGWSAPLAHQWKAFVSVRSLPGPQRTLRAKVLPRVALQLALAFSSTLGGRGGPPQCPGAVRGPCGFLGQMEALKTVPPGEYSSTRLRRRPIPRAAPRLVPLLWNFGEKGCRHLREWCPWQPG